VEAASSSPLAPLGEHSRLTAPCHSPTARTQLVDLRLQLLARMRRRGVTASVRQCFQPECVSLGLQLKKGPRRLGRTRFRSPSTELTWCVARARRHTASRLGAPLSCALFRSQTLRSKVSASSHALTHSRLLARARPTGTKADPGRGSRGGGTQSAGRRGREAAAGRRGGGSAFHRRDTEAHGARR